MVRVVWDAAKWLTEIVTRRGDDSLSEEEGMARRNGGVCEVAW